MNDYDPGYICNKSDSTGLYSFENQPVIALKNIAYLGSALAPLFVQQGRKEIMLGYEQSDVRGLLQETINIGIGLFKKEYKRLMMDVMIY